MVNNKENKLFSKKNIMGMIIVFLMVFSILGIWQGSQDETPSYNGYPVKQEDNKYVIKSDNGVVSGYTHPAYVDTIALDTSLPAYVSLYYSSYVIVLFDPTDTALPYIEVLRMDLAQEDLLHLSKSVSFGITQANESYSYPIVNCTSSVPVLYLRTNSLNSSSRIYEDENCLVLEATTWRDLVLLKDRVVYTLFDIMK